MARARSDKLFQNRQAGKSFSRPNTATKSPRERILIVCEGEVTEPRYFEELCKDLGLNSANIKIYGKECGSVPSSVYNYTLQELERDGDYDRAYCVFDKDQHACYDKILDAIRRNKKFKIIAANSVPCFEYWVLLHFEQSTSYFDNSEELAKRIKKHWKEYDKEKIKDLYPHLKDKTDIAIKNAKAVAEDDHGDNPSTKVHVLAEDLINQGKKIVKPTQLSLSR